MKKDSVLTHMKGEPHKLAMKLEHESEFLKQPGPLNIVFHFVAFKSNQC